MRMLLYFVLSGWMCGCDPTPASAPPEALFAQTPEQRLILVMDRNNDGVLDLEEVQQITEGQPDAADIDLDGNGIVQAPELRQVLNRISPLWRTWPDPLKPLQEQDRMKYKHR